MRKTLPSPSPSLMRQQQPSSPPYRNKPSVQHARTRVCSVMREWDLLPTWNKQIYDATELCQGSLTKIWSYAASWMPWPFKDRDSIMRFHG